MRLAECVLTGNRSIAEYAFRFNDNVYWLPGAVEADRYPVRRHRSRRPVVIGWAGHAAQAHLREIEPALRELATRHPVVLAVASDDAYALQGFAGEVRWERWSRDREYAFFGDLDIGVMPLLDTPYNRGKEGYKIKEYMAAGLPVVCSPVGYNAELVTPEVDGLHAVTHEDWVAALTRLVEDPELRARMGASGRAKATSQFDAAEQAVKLAQFVRRVASGARTDTGLIAWRSRLETDGC